MAIIMTIEQAIYILETHNKWRRGDNNLEMTDPEILGVAIDIVVNTFKKKPVGVLKREKSFTQEEIKSLKKIFSTEIKGTPYLDEITRPLTEEEKERIELMFNCKFEKTNRDYEDHMDRGILEDAISDTDEKFEHRHIWDVKRIQLLCYNRGHVVSLEDCAMLWENYSERLAAGWLQLDKTDDEVFEHIKRVDILDFNGKFFG